MTATRPRRSYRIGSSLLMVLLSPRRSDWASGARLASQPTYWERTPVGGAGHIDRGCSRDTLPTKRLTGSELSSTSNDWPSAHDDVVRGIDQLLLLQRADRSPTTR